MMNKQKRIINLTTKFQNLVDVVNNQPKRCVEQEELLVRCGSYIKQVEELYASIGELRSMR